jgi:flagellar biosynthesis chaperone FliJ
MSILVNPHNEQEEKALLAFLNSRQYDYKPGVGESEDEAMTAFLDTYNKEIDEAVGQIENGEFYTQDEVEKMLQERRNARNGS